MEWFIIIVLVLIFIFTNLPAKNRGDSDDKNDINVKNEKNIKCEITQKSEHDEQNVCIEKQRNIYGIRSIFPDNSFELNKEGFYNPKYYPIKISQHAKERLQDRLEIEYYSDMYRYIEKVYKNGKSRYQVDKDVA